MTGQPGTTEGKRSNSLPWEWAAHWAGSVVPYQLAAWYERLHRNSLGGRPLATTDAGWYALNVWGLVQDQWDGDIEPFQQWMKWLYQR